MPGCCGSSESIVDDSQIAADPVPRVRKCAMPVHRAKLYEAIGGADACHKLSTAFYARVARDPLLRPLFPGKIFTCAIEEFAAFLVQLLEGPSAAHPTSLVAELARIPSPFQNHTAAQRRVDEEYDSGPR